MSALASLNAARAAWERTSPQLTIDGWADALDEADRGKPVGLVEPAGPPPESPPAPSGGLALTQNGFGHALHDEDGRGRTQKGA